MPVYVVLGGLAWLAMRKSGIHPTLAGVVLGLMTPAAAWVGPEAFRTSVAAVLGRIDDLDIQVEGPEREALAHAARESVSPLERLERLLHPWVGFAVMPLFALANAGVAVSTTQLTSPVAVAVAAGLFVGKPLGVLLLSWLAVRGGLAWLPDGVSRGMVLGGGCLAGIGFTMSMFVAGPAQGNEHLAAGKIGTLSGSVLSAIVGTAVLARASGERRRQSRQPTSC